MSLEPQQAEPTSIGQTHQSYLDKLLRVLSADLNFHDQDSSYASHDFHSFPAKFPPQLPRRFIESLTVPGDLVLDPMMGSGTTLVEAFLLGRQAVGFDIDPLAVLLTRTKATSLNPQQVARIGRGIVHRAKRAVFQDGQMLERELAERCDPKTRDFLNYWFAHETQIALLSLIKEIEQISDDAIRAFFKLAFSAIIITKSGGVSLALDLAHSRPHRAKVVFDETGTAILGPRKVVYQSNRLEFSTKRLRSPFEEFEKRVSQNIKGLLRRPSDLLQPYLIGLGDPAPDVIEPHAGLADAQHLPLREDSVDMIVTSPPYAFNGIDYMRSNKFSLVWFGYSITDLGFRRQTYIGGDSTTGFVFEEMPEHTTGIIAALNSRDKKKGRALHRYYSEMARVLREMFRVLKPGKCAIMVVGSSVARGLDIEPQICLSEIGHALGFAVPKIGVRRLDRNRRMMPAGTKLNVNSQIEQRLHEEYIIAFYKQPF